MPSTSRIPDDEYDFSTPATILPAKSKSEQAWLDLVKLAPDLEQLHRRTGNANRPPRALADLFFLSLCACFADPTKKEILRALILDLLADDLVDFMLAPEKE